ncbi:hypothetical protein BGX28_005825 [Mortierella sp. GBA30]|nr:hypothetical protein BGX28_005825 [Mortierella sp. GBA30]
MTGYKAPKSELKELKLTFEYESRTEPMSCFTSLESLELGPSCIISSISIARLFMYNPNLRDLVIPPSCVESWINAVDMGFSEALRSIRIHAPLHTKTQTSHPSSVITIHPYSFPPFCLSNLESIDLGIGSGEFVKALITRPTLPALRTLRILYPSNSTLQRLSRRLASQLTKFEAKLDEGTKYDPDIYQKFSEMTMLLVMSLDCGLSPALELNGRNITTLSANSSMKLIDSIADLCPNLEDLTLRGGSISKRNSCPRIRSDLQDMMIYIVEICPLKRLRLENAYLALGARFWQACGEFGNTLQTLDIELFDGRGMSSCGLFEGLKHCKKLTRLRLTDLHYVRQGIMVPCLMEMTQLRSLSLSIPIVKNDSFFISMEEISDFLSSFPDLSKIHLVLPRLYTDSDLATMPDTQAAAAIVFKNALGQSIHGSVELSGRSIEYY